ncbi:hypothetical protein LP414_27575 [Polaromonas sp. P1(28)-13]|nr:hypothetical protein LP414_27575 [Polaromonas sp. P1(28)-13]
MPKPTNNTELVTQMMEFSRFGPLAQIFILDALNKHVARVIASKPEDYPAEKMPFGMTGEAWIDLAKDLKRQMDEFYDRHG